MKYLEVEHEDAVIGIVWQDPYGWACEVSATGLGYCGIDTKEEAKAAVVKAHQECIEYQAYMFLE